MKKIKLYNTLLLLSLLASCAMPSHHDQMAKEVALKVLENTQCIKNYKVYYSHNDVPDWDNAPEGFCSEKGERAVPTGHSLMPLRFSKSKNASDITQSESWFYVTWVCYQACSKTQPDEVKSK